jgi:pilus assembly protein CpaB
MKNTKALAMLVMAILIGLAAAVYAAGWVNRQSSTPHKVVVAAVDIELGSRINAPMLSTVDWPSGALPAGAFSDPKDVQDRVLKVGVMRGDAIVDRKLAPTGAQGGLSAVIADGKRAMTVRVNDVVGVAGFALPGTFVDVMVNAQQEHGRGEEGRQISKTVLEQVLVLAVAQEAGRDDTKPRVVSAVTLELSPEDAEKLDLARSIGTLSLVLRNQVDRKSVSTAGMTKSQLFGEPAAQPVKAVAASRAQPVKTIRSPAPVLATPLTPAPPARQCVEVIQGGLRVLNCF